MRGALRITISPDDVGRRVSVRSRHPDDAQGHTMTDAVGHLLSWTGGVLQIRRRDGSVATLPESDLLAGKVLPDAAPTRRSERYPR